MVARPAQSFLPSPIGNEESAHDVACGFYWTEGIRGLGWAIDAVPTLKGGSTMGIASPPAVQLPAGAGLVTPGLSDAERLQGFPAGWTAPGSPSVGRAGVTPAHLPLRAGHYLEPAVQPAQRVVIAPEFGGDPRPGLSEEQLHPLIGAREGVVGDHICWRWQLTDLLVRLLAGPDGQIPEHIRPLADALISMPRPSAGYTTLACRPETRTWRRSNAG